MRISDWSSDVCSSDLLKGCSATEAHKTEKGLIAVGLGSPKELSDALRAMKARAGADFDGGWLVQEMVKGSRELMIGMTRDPVFGPSVAFGLGGIFTEILQDRSEEHTSELQSLMRISYAVF